MLFQPLLRWGLTRYKEEYRWDVKNKGLKWKPGGKSVLYPSGPSSRSLTRFPQHEATKIITTPPPLTPLTPTGWDARPSQGYPKLPWQFAGSPFFLLGGDRHSESKVFSHARNVRCEISPLDWKFALEIDSSPIQCFFNAGFSWNRRRGVSQPSLRARLPWHHVRHQADFGRKRGKETSDLRAHDERDSTESWVLSI